MTVAHKVSVFVCHFTPISGSTTTYAGIAQHPYRVVAKILMDATRDYPMSEIGRILKESETLTCPSVAVLKTCSVRKALDILREYAESNVNVVTEYNYSVIDDEDLIQAPLIRTVYMPPRPDMVCWGSEQALSSFEDQFFTAQHPEQFLEGSLSDMLVTLFRELVVESRSPLGHSMAYNKTNRSVLIRTRQYPFFDTCTLYKFCTMAVSWMATALEYVVSRIISGCRNDLNDTYNTPLMIQKAFVVYRHMHTVEGNKTWLECMTSKRCSMTVQVTQSFASVITDFAETDHSIRYAFEKLRRMVPDDHPISPDFKRYQRKLHRLDGVEPAQTVLSPLCDTTT